MDAGCFGVVASEGDFNVSVFKQVGDFAYLWGCNGEGSPLCYFQHLCGV